MVSHLPGGVYYASTRAFQAQEWAIVSAHSGYLRATIIARAGNPFLTMHCIGGGGRPGQGQSGGGRSNLAGRHPNRRSGQAVS